MTPRFPALSAALALAAALSLNTSGALAQTAAPAAPAAPDAMSRKGFTLQVSLGFGAAILSAGGKSETNAGLGGANLMLGGFVNPNLAIVASFQGVNYGLFKDGGVNAIAGTFGPAVQYWINDMFNVVGGVGLGLLYQSIDVNFGGGSISGSSKKAGLGLQVGGNWMFLRKKHHSLGLGFMFAPVITSDVNAYTIQGALAYQFH